MTEEIIKSLYFYIAVLSCFGILILLKRDLKVGIAFFVILLFCLSWRGFSYYHSYRYYSILIFLGLYLSSYAFICFKRISKNKYIQKYTALFFFSILILIHIEKVFSSFRNVYILDLQDRVKRIQINEPESNIYVYDKDNTRIGYNTNTNHNRIKIFHSDIHTDLRDLYIQNGTFRNSLYLIYPNKYSFRGNGDKKPDAAKYFEIEHHLSNSKHTSFVSVYQHLPYSPSPGIKIDQYYKHATLKAYIPEYETYIYQVQNKFVWLIGTDVEDKTEIIYHIHTSQPDLLPQNRIKHGFENWGFNINDKSEKERIGKYRVFEKPIPSQYPVTYIGAGFNNNGVIVWRSFNYTPAN